MLPLNRHRFPPDRKAWGGSELYRQALSPSFLSVREARDVVGNFTGDAPVKLDFWGELDTCSLGKELRFCLRYDYPGVAFIWSI